MGCIETSCCMRLQLRWLINFNMGCIETRVVQPQNNIGLVINFNMGCIETVGIMCIWWHFY